MSQTALHSGSDISDPDNSRTDTSSTPDKSNLRNGFCLGLVFWLVQ